MDLRAGSASSILEGLSVKSVLATIVMPYTLRLPDGLFGQLRCSYKGGVGGALGGGRTSVSLRFDAPEPISEEEQEALKARYAQRLLREANRLLRWYRAVTQQTGIVELTRAEASPFEFTYEEDGAAWGGDPVFYAQESFSGIPDPMEDIATKVRAGLDDEKEPDVADLFLLDAEEARRTGRFRESVLFCWSTIDATFNRRYDALVDQALIDEPRPARDFFKSAGGGTHFPLKHKMGAALYLLTGRTLTREPWWEDLSASYAKRNAIIHAGEGADEADAERAIHVARQVVTTMRAPELALLPDRLRAATRS
jgi:hypothetical protein